MIVALVRVDHKELVRRTDEKRAPFRMLLYILWEVKCQVYSFWPHLKTPPTTFFDCFSSQGVSLFFAEQNEQAQYSAHLQAFKTISKTNTERTLPNKNEQKTNNAISISTWFELLCSVVRQGLWYTPALVLTPAPRCPVRRFRETARVTCRRKQGGHKSAHSARVTVTPTVTRHSYRHPENNAGKSFS